MSALIHNVDVLAESVESALNVSAFRKLGAVKRRNFAVDLALIALGCRPAYLVDAIAARDPETLYPGLLEDLRKVRQPRILCYARLRSSAHVKSHAEFRAVEHVFESSSQQSFFVNCDTLRRHLCDGLLSDVAFIQLQQSPLLMHEPPPEIQDTIEALLASTPPRWTDDLDPQTIIPVAAILLGYPVAYVPVQMHGAFLAGVPLDVYSCIVRNGTTLDGHTFLKFSCPADLAVAHPESLGVNSIVEKLKRRFKSRLEEERLSMTVEVTREIMDRVAL